MSLNKEAASFRRVTNLRLADLCFIDLETTGSLFGYHEIIDIGIIRTDPHGDRVLRMWQQRVQPSQPRRITSKAAELTGYDPRKWTGAEPSSRRLWEEFNQVVEGCVPVCHNPSFDRAFVSLAARDCGIEELSLDYHWIGTESLAWPLYSCGALDELSLAGLSRFFQLGEEPYPHSAINGARTCHAVYRKLVEYWNGHPFGGRA